MIKQTIDKLKLGSVVTLPEELTDKQINKICKVYKLNKNDTIYAVIDDTYFKGYSRGILFTDTKIIWKDFFTLETFEYSNIKNISVSKKKNYIIIKINNETNQLSMPMGVKNYILHAASLK